MSDSRWYKERIEDVEFYIGLAQELTARARDGGQFVLNGAIKALTILQPSIEQLYASSQRYEQLEVESAARYEKTLQLFMDRLGCSRDEAITEYESIINKTPEEWEEMALTTYRRAAEEKDGMSKEDLEKLAEHYVQTAVWKRGMHVIEEQIGNVLALEAQIILLRAQKRDYYRSQTQYSEEQIEQILDKPETLYFFQIEDVRKEINS